MEPSSVGADTDGSSASSEVPVRRPLWSRPWVRVLGLGLLVGALAAGAVPVVVLGPYVRDDLRLDAIVKAVALDWRDFGEARAVQRMEYELDHQSIGSWVEDNDCAMSTQGAERTVRCAWGIGIPVPATEWMIPVTFESVATVDPSGDVR
jgi:hypothetical protein